MILSSIVGEVQEPKETDRLTVSLWREKCLSY